MNAQIQMSDEEEPAVEEKTTGRDRLEALARDARPEEATEAGKRRVLEEWWKANRVVSQAKQMLLDAIKTRDAAAEKVVATLGRGNLRYKDVLYSPSAKGDTIYLRELVKKPHG
jgi:hypothetical protein